MLTGKQFVEKLVQDNQALFKAARERGWMIVIERKDMIYVLTKDGDHYTVSTTNV